MISPLSKLWLRSVYNGRRFDSAQHSRCRACRSGRPAYCIKRSDLVGYRRILTVWRDTQPAASVKRVIDHWLGVLAEIEADTKAVLNILVSCK